MLKTIVKWWRNWCRDIYWSRLARVCPRFYEDMPEDKPGKWVAVAIRTNPFNGGREIYNETVEGYLNAYVRARELALRLDRETPYADGELGVKWGIRKETVCSDQQAA